MSLGDLKWGLGTVHSRAEDYARFKDYYAGRHVLAYTSERYRNVFAAQLKHLRDNLCPAVVDALADRIQLLGFQTEDANAQALIQEVWTANRLDRRQGEVHLATLRDGDGYLMVWPDSTGLARFYPQRADRMAVLYDDEDPSVVSLAVKVWPEHERDEDSGRETVYWRANLYYADTIEKYRQKVGTALAEGSTQEAPMPLDIRFYDVWVDEEGDPWPYENKYGAVPVFPLVNNGMPGEQGKSELWDVIPIQDALNKTVADLMVAMETHALPQRHATGLAVEQVVMPDGSTEDRPPVFQPGGLWWTQSDKAQFGEFTAGNLEAIVAVADQFRSEVARVSRTPIHYLILSGQFPSGEALRTAEAPLVAKATDREQGFSDPWEGAMAFALLVQGVTSTKAITATWKDTVSRGEKEHAETMALHREAGISQAEHLKGLGYTQADIERMDAEREEEGADQGAMAAAAFNSGLPVPPPRAAGLGAIDVALEAALAAQEG